VRKGPLGRQAYIPLCWWFELFLFWNVLWGRCWNGLKPQTRHCYVGIVICHHKDTYQPTSILRCSLWLQAEVHMGSFWLKLPQPAEVALEKIPWYQWTRSRSIEQATKNKESMYRPTTIAVSSKFHIICFLFLCAKRSTSFSRPTFVRCWQLARPCCILCEQLSSRGKNMGPLTFKRLDTPTTSRVWSLKFLFQGLSISVSLHF